MGAIAAAGIGSLPSAWKNHRPWAPAGVPGNTDPEPADGAGLPPHLPGPDLLTAGQRLGDPDRHCTHTLHIEPDGSFSIVVLMWQPGQATCIHDHITWCAFAVLEGAEHEELCDAQLHLIGEQTNHPGDVQALTPPGDIHRVRNAGATTAISLRVYGTDASAPDPASTGIYD